MKIYVPKALEGFILRRNIRCIGQESNLFIRIPRFPYMIIRKDKWESKCDDANYYYNKLCQIKIKQVQKEKDKKQVEETEPVNN